MVRRRGASDRIVLDLGAFGEIGTDGHDEPRDDDAGRGGEGLRPDEGTSAQEDDAALDEERSAHARARRIRRVFGAGAVALLVFSAWGTAAEVRDHERAARLIDAPGGVLSLAEAPRVTWSAATESANVTAYMPGLVVVRRGTVLHGLDAGTGTERWQVPVGGDPQCTAYASTTGAPAAADPLVCWGGPNASPQVTVVHADGSWTTRPLDGDVVQAAGTADGGIATVHEVGPEVSSDQVTVTAADGGGYTIEGTITRGPDVVVRLEDAATGALRWERTVPFQPGADPWSCGSVDRGGTAAEPTYTYSPRPPQVGAAGGLIQVWGCGVQAALAADGAAVTGATTADWQYTQSYPDGGVLESVTVTQDPAGDTSVVRRDGRAVTLAGQVLVPAATDGAPSDVVLAQASYGMALTAYRPDGSELWHGRSSYASLLVRANGIAVLSLTEGGVAGVDLRTGDELWENDDLESVAPGEQTFPQNAFTDGRVAALVLAHFTATVDENGGTIGASSTSASLVALDIATGEVRWRQALPGGGASIDAVEGHLVRTAQDDNTFINDDGPDGAFVNHSPGTVYSLG